ncbi:WD-40 repeat-containing protein [Reticulomyxa filosa]|uniref:WD-40 repeat-containing protein n=1 Tax=Reticulomyxa filosa TaxID=46433 RepID=X6MPE2_RETFI|nr:WD-40 repeat-containing protein [Reticulomyxa filosa]|eukprot:ETO14930.1 WD-40 repeat-containing protein [Reticulomyxa filosa]
MGHEGCMNSVKYGSNELVNIILSGSNDKSVRLWDIRSDQQIQVFNGHTGAVSCVDYSPFVIKNNSEAVGGNSNVICSGSIDNTIRFWDVRSNKNELYMVKGEGDDGIICFKFLQLRKNEKKRKSNDILLVV